MIATPDPSLSAIAGLVPTDGFYHWGIVAEDFDATCEELGAVCSLTWAVPMKRRFELLQPSGVMEVEFRLTYSVEGPPHYEILEASPGTLWDPATANGGVHHLGFWSTDVTGDATRLIAAGYECGATAATPDGKPVGFSYHRLHSGLWVELVDLARKPAYDQWIAGGDFPSFPPPGSSPSD